MPAAVDDAVTAMGLTVQKAAVPCPQVEFVQASFGVLNAL
jgi:hypothetical protein